MTLLAISCSGPNVPAWLRDPHGPIVPHYGDPPNGENQHPFPALAADAGAP